MTECWPLIGWGCGYDLSIICVSITDLTTTHDALVLLKNSLSSPKLLYTLRTSECCDSPVLPQIDAALRDGLSRILGNIRDSPSRVLIHQLILDQTVKVTGSHVEDVRVAGILY